MAADEIICDVRLTPEGKQTLNEIATAVKVFAKYELLKPDEVDKVIERIKPIILDQIQVILPGGEVA
jgi:hypothetical protein